MERELFVRHRANRGLVGHKPRKVDADIGGAVFLSIERNHAVSLCASQVDQIFTRRVRTSSVLG